MKIKDHKKNCKYHVENAFEERFTDEDFIYTDNYMRVTDLTKLVKDSINNAPKMGHYVPGGKGNCAIFEIKYNNIKPVYVVWNMLISCAATVFTKEMYVNYYVK